MFNKKKNLRLILNLIYLSPSSGRNILEGKHRRSFPNRLTIRDVLTFIWDIVNR